MDSLARISSAIENSHSQIVALTDRCTALQTRVDELERSRAGRKNASEGSDALVAALGHMANAASENTRTQVELITRLLDRSAKQAFAATAAEMGKRSAQVRREKKRAAEMAETEREQLVGPLKIAQECEECTALIERRPPSSARDMMRHASEKHAQFVLPLVMGNGATGELDS